MTSDRLGQLQVKCPCGAGFKATATASPGLPLKGFMVGCSACGRMHEAGEVDAATVELFAEAHEQAFGEVESDG